MNNALGNHSFTQSFCIVIRVDLDKRLTFSFFSVTMTTGPFASAPLVGVSSTRFFHWTTKFCRGLGHSMRSAVLAVTPFVALPSGFCTNIPVKAGWQSSDMHVLTSWTICSCLLFSKESRHKAACEGAEWAFLGARSMIRDAISCTTSSR